MIAPSESAYVERLQAERAEARDEAWRLKALVEDFRRTLEGPGSADDKVRSLLDRLNA